MNWRCRFKDCDFDYFEEVVFFFETLSDYLQTIEACIDTSIQRTEQSRKSCLDLILEGESWEGELSLESYSLLQKQYLKSSYFDSLVIAIHTFFVKKLKSFCERFERQSEIKRKEVKSKGIVQFKAYFATQVSIDFKPVETEWQKIVLLNKLRNRIVHAENSRTIAKSDKILLRSLNLIRGIEIKETPHHFEFYLTTKAILDFSYSAHEFLEHVCFERTELE